MSKGGSMIGAVLISVLLTLTLTGVGIYFGLPLLYPNIVVEMQEIELDSTAYINDDTDVGNYHLIPETNLTITVGKNARLLTRFSAMGFLHLGNDFSDHTIYDIKLAVDGVGNNTVAVRYFLSSPATVFIEFSQSIYIEYFTPALPVGTYTVSVYWRSRVNPPGITQLSLCHPAVNHTRTLVVEEFRAS